MSWKVTGPEAASGQVCRWRDEAMVSAGPASAFLATEKNLRKITDYRDLWMLDAILNGSKSVSRPEIA
jgi:hypothetical protein